MRMSQKNFCEVCRSTVTNRLPILYLLLAVCCAALAQQGNGGSAKADLTGHYEGTAKNKAEDVTTVALELTDKDGALSGAIHSSHGDFQITSGTRKGDAVTIEFDANGAAGTISLHAAENKLVGTWSAGDDGGSLDVKKAAQQEPPKGKS